MITHLTLYRTTRIRQPKAPSFLNMCNSKMLVASIMLDLTLIDRTLLRWKTVYIANNSKICSRWNKCNT